MLRRLHIVDLAIIKDVELAPGPGFNVLTGETGAGKSIIVSAAGLLCGGRGTTEMVRKGRKEAVVEALFDLSGAEEARRAVEEAGLLQGDELLIRRVIPAGGRGRVHVNGSLCTVAVLRRIAGRLLEISGQHEHQLLSQRRIQRRILDEMALTPAQLQALRAGHQGIRELLESLAGIQMDEAQRAERADFLRYQLRELRAARLQPGEDARLLAEQKRLLGAAELLETATTGEEQLYSGGDSVSDRLSLLERRLGAMAKVDEGLAGLAGQLEEARVQVEDVAHSLRRYAGGEDLDPARLEQVEQRLSEIHRLSRKHGRTVDEVLARQGEMEEQLAQLEQAEERIARLDGELERARRQAAALAEAATLARTRAARRLSGQVTGHLTRLRMEGARLSVAVTGEPAREGDEAALMFEDRRLGPTGWDRVELLISTNPGEASGPLSRLASGGELSRVMLALRQAVGSHHPAATSIFDEVDAGIGGAVADVVGRYLAGVARHQQVLCVTHLPQVAAHADHHFHVGKATRRKRTRSTLAELDETARLEELAQMLGGEAVHDEARRNAQRLVAAAQTVKKQENSN